MKYASKKMFMVTAIAGAAVLMGSGPAQAYTMAGSVIEMTDFVVLGSDGQILDADDDFDFNITFTGTADASTDLNGVSSTLSGTNPPMEIDLALQCTGDCGAFAENTFPHLLPPPTGNYAAADQLEIGAPVTGLGFATGATVSNGSWVALDTLSGDASADSNNNLNSSFIFVLNNDQATGITFEFMADAYFQAAITSDETFPGTATAASSFSFTLSTINLDGTLTQIWNFAPDGIVNATGETADGFNLNDTISLNAPLPIDVFALNDSGGAVFFSSTTGALTAGTIYQLSARINTDVDVLRAAVPEPGVLALLGIGLLGFGAMRRQWHKPA